MRHRKKRNKLSRDAAHRESLLSNLSKQLIEHERIKTSQAKAKAVKPEVEQLITLAKRGDLHARRQALATLHNDKFIVHKLFEEVAPRYAERPGGYTRIVKLGPRRVRLHRDGLSRAGVVVAVEGTGYPSAGQVVGLISPTTLSIRPSEGYPVPKLQGQSRRPDFEVQAVGWGRVAGLGAGGALVGASGSSRRCGGMQPFRASCRRGRGPCFA